MKRVWEIAFVVILAFVIASAAEDGRGTEPESMSRQSEDLPVKISASRGLAVFLLEGNSATLLPIDILCEFGTYKGKNFVVNIEVPVFDQSKGKTIVVRRLMESEQVLGASMKSTAQFSLEDVEAKGAITTVRIFLTDGSESEKAISNTLSLNAIIGEEALKQMASELGITPKELSTTEPAHPEIGDGWRDPISGVSFMWVPPGEFQMGSPSFEPGRRSNEGPRHSVRITKGFWLGRTEVTQSQWKAIMGDNPSFSGHLGDEFPVNQVHWEKIQEYIGELNERLGSEKYRLPTEAEWEYACRAGKETAYSFGQQILPDQANFDASKPYASAIRGINHGSPIAVASYPPNSWGFYDMHGNLDEFCQDWYDDLYYDIAGEGATDPQGPYTGRNRVCRGGSWDCSGLECRSAERTIGLGGWTDGFRLVREPTTEAQAKHGK